MELSQLRETRGEVVECVDNDETAAVVAGLVSARLLVILTPPEGIYLDPNDPGTLVREVTASTPEAVVERICELQTHCVGASRAGANGAYAKLEYIKVPVQRGSTVFIANARHRLSDIVEGRVACTRIGVE